MSARQTIITAWLVVFCLGRPCRAVDEFSFPVPMEPPVAGRHVLLVANYDHQDSFDADFAVGNPLAGGMDATFEATGHTGGAARIVGPSTSIHYSAFQDTNPARGTILLRVKASDSLPLS